MARGKSPSHFHFKTVNIIIIQILITLSLPSEAKKLPYNRLLAHPNFVVYFV